MAEENLSSSPDSRGTFDKFQGTRALSNVRTLDEPEEEPTEGKTEESKPESTDVVDQLRQELRRKDEALNRLAQKGALYEKRLQELEPAVRAGVVLLQHPEGARILEKLASGEELTAGETKKVKKAEQATSTALSANEVRGIFREEMQMRDMAQKHTERLLKNLRSEYTDFDDIMVHPRFWPTVDMALEQIAKGYLPLEQDGADAYEEAFKHAYNFVRGSNPVYQKAALAEARATERDKARQVAAASAANGSSGPSEETTRKLTPDEESRVRLLRLYHGLEPKGGPTGRRFSE